MFLGEQRRMSSFVHEQDFVYMTSNSNNITYKWSELLKFLRLFMETSAALVNQEGLSFL